MIESGSLQAATAGLKQALDQFRTSAQELTAQVDPGRLAAGVVELQSDKAAVEAGAAVVRTLDETVGTLLDVLA